MRITDMTTFHQYVGETIMYCQCIEHDIKWIYAGMHKGNDVSNFENLEKSKATLGKVLGMLKELDNERDPYLSEADYELLRQVTTIRNHWAHKAYTEFVYCKGDAWDTEFTRQARRLENDHNRLDKLSQSIERVRLDVLKKYGRI